MTAEEFKTMFLPCSACLYRVAYALTGSKAEAEDLVQETFAKLWMSRDKLGAISSAEGFAIAVLRNMYVDSQRIKTVAGYDVYADEDNSQAIDDIGHTIELRNAKDIIMEIVEALPLNQRQVMKMRDIADMSFEDISQATGLSAGNIRTILSRARNKVKEQYLKLMNYGLE